eukprot:ANDGO_02724.mRNA.1 hypothetical protein
MDPILPDGTPRKKMASPGKPLTPAKRVSSAQVVEDMLIIAEDSVSSTYSSASTHATPIHNRLASGASASSSSSTPLATPIFSSSTTPGKRIRLSRTDILGLLNEKDQSSSSGTLKTRAQSLASEFAAIKNGTPTKIEAASFVPPVPVVHSKPSIDSEQHHEAQLRSESPKRVFADSLEIARLPESYRMLYSQFAALETAFMFLHMRKQTTSLPRLREAVQRITKKVFEDKHLAQALYLFPESYRVQVGVDSQLVLLADEVPLKPDRVDQFRDRLVAFWESVAKTDNVEVPEMILPLAQEKKAYSYASFKEDVQAIIPKVESPMIRAALERKYGSPSKFVEREDLKGIAPHIVEMVRKKEMERQLVRDSGYLERMQKRKDVQEAIALMDCTRSIMKAEKKSSMMLEDLKKKVHPAMRIPVSKERLTELVEMLLREAPEWARLQDISSGKCFVLSKSADAKVADIKNRLQSLIPE